MLFLLYKNRHVVVADLPGDTTELESPVEVKKYLGIHESIEGVARRGRPPVFRKPVPVADLSILASVSDAHRKAAEEAFGTNTAQLPQVPAEARTAVPPAPAAVAAPEVEEEALQDEVARLFAEEEPDLSEDDSFLS